MPPLDTVLKRRPIFPSDVAGNEASEFLLAGRVIDVDGSGARVGDAVRTVEIAGSIEAVAGDLVVLEVRRSAGALVAIALVERHRPTRPRGAEAARFVEGGVGANLALRARAFAAIRSFFAGESFIEVDTPLLVPSPGLDVHLDAVKAEEGFLVTSPEYQMKRLLAGGFPRIFQLAHVFRRAEIGERHNPEFTMLEWYRAFASVEDVMRDTERIVTDVYAALAAETPGHRKPSIKVTPPFARLSVARAFERFAGIAEAEFFAMVDRDLDRYFRVLVDHVEPAIAREPKPIFLIDYPISQASLARPKPSDPRVCERFELYLGGVELCNGFGELTDPVEQRRRLLSDQAARRATGKPVYPLDERFLAALEEGMPPSAGNALGVDRLVALCSGEREIGRVMAFPAGQI